MPDIVLIRSEDRNGNLAYLRRDREGNWRCTSKTGTPLDWGYIGVDNMVECRHALELSDGVAQDYVYILRRYADRYKSGEKEGETTHTYTLIAN